jgi:hypothetical protein
VVSRFLGGLAMHRTTPLVSILAVAIVATTTAPCVAEDSAPITACETTVHGRNHLIGDLDCSAATGPAIILENGASLDLGGFTLTGATIGVRCLVGRCKITGPGTIRRVAPGDQSTHHGIQSFRRARIRGVTLENWGRAVFGLGPTDVRDSIVMNGSYGVVAGPARVSDSMFFNVQQVAVYAYEGTKDGIHYTFYPARVRGCQFAGNSIDIAAFKRPSVGDSNCTTSYMLTVPAPSRPYGGGDEWDVCP